MIINFKTNLGQALLTSWIFGKNADHKYRIPATIIIWKLNRNISEISASFFTENLVLLNPPPVELYTLEDLALLLRCYCVIERWIILFIFVLDHLSPHQPRKLEYLCRLSVFFLLSFLFFQANADFNYFFEIQAKTVGIYIIWNKSLDCWTKQKFLFLLRMIDCFLFGVSKTFPFTGFEYIGWLNGGGAMVGSTL